MLLSRSRHQNTAIWSTQSAAISTLSSVQIFCADQFAARFYSSSYSPSPRTTLHIAFRQHSTISSALAARQNAFASTSCESRWVRTAKVLLKIAGTLNKTLRIDRARAKLDRDEPPSRRVYDPSGVLRSICCFFVGLDRCARARACVLIVNLFISGTTAPRAAPLFN